MLDEPVSALTCPRRPRCSTCSPTCATTRQLALLFIAHDLGVVRFLAQRVVVLYRGQVMEAGPVEEVTQRPRPPLHRRADRGGPGAAARRAGPPPRRPRGARRRDGRRGAARRRPAARSRPLPPRHRRVPRRAAAACPSGPTWSPAITPTRPPGSGYRSGQPDPRVPDIKLFHSRFSPSGFLGHNCQDERVRPSPLTWRSLCCSSSPTASCGAWRAPATRTRAATSTATPGSPSTCGRPSSASRQGEGVQRLGAVARRCRPGGGDEPRTPTGSPSNGRGSSRPKASSLPRPWPTTRRSPEHCLARGLAPVVTFNHFTSPHWFAMRAGWLSPEAPALFAQILRPGDGRVR